MSCASRAGFQPAARGLASDSCANPPAPPTHASRAAHRHKNMTKQHREYVIDDDPARIDLPRVHGWLASTYWSPGVSRDVVERAVRGSSLVIGAYASDGGAQVGITRVV